MSEQDVLNQVPLNNYTAGAGQTEFDFIFRVDDATFLEVRVNNVVQVNGVDYTINSGSLNNESGGRITFAAGRTAGQIITLKRVVPKQRPTKFSPGAEIDATTHELDADTIVMMIQDLARDIQRAPRIVDTFTLAANATVTFDAPIDGRGVYWFQSGSNWILRTTTTSFADLEAAGAIIAANIASINAVAGSISAVNNVSGNLTNINNVAAASTNINTVAGNITNVNTVASANSNINTVVANMASITGASAAASAAASAQTAAEAARDATLAAFDNFDDRYLGPKASDPTLDNDGNALVAGSIYFNTTDASMKVYTGSVWVAAYVSGTDFLARANNLSDLSNAAVARTNLGLGALAQLASVGTAQIGDNAVTYAKMQDISNTARVLGRRTAGAGDPEECTLSQVLDMVGSAAQGDILYRGSAGWERLPAGTSGHFLRTNGAGANPSYAPAGSRTPTRQVFTSGSGTYTTPAGVNYIVVRMVGGGGAGENNNGAGGGGGTTSFGSFTAVGGSTGNIRIGGAGGTGGTGSASVRIPGQNGGDSVSTTPIIAGAGGNSPFGGAGPSVIGRTHTLSARPNSGSGGPGDCGTTSGSARAGGGAGEYVEFTITAPAATYSYAVGAGGISAFNPGWYNGGSGIIIVDEY